ncbi:MAG: hypothetical protein OXL36_09000 [Bryobacterales bacterium]|nr:hypothetical protein [Bryobacterales bacterium]MDE0293028.1 hypothetical protein [Bryobacterales bacterium]
MPWRIATGLSLIFWVIFLLLAGERLKYMEPYAELLFARYSVIVSLYLMTAIVTVYAFIYWLARRAGLGDLGGKIKLMDKRLAAGDSHDAELAERMKRERAGDLV